VILKFVSHSQDDHLLGYFSLGDYQTNQVAWDGVLRLRLQSGMALNLSSEEEGSSPLRVSKTFYDQVFAIGATNFHWENYGTILKVDDLVFRFSIPYDHFKQSVSRGKTVRIQMDYSPKGAPQTLSATRDIVLY
jgi:hypothetical protein